MTGVSEVDQQKLRTAGRDVIKINVWEWFLHGEQVAAFGRHITDRTIFAVPHREIDTGAVGKKIRVTNQRTDAGYLSDSNYAGPRYRRAQSHERHDEDQRGLPQ